MTRAIFTDSDEKRWFRGAPDEDDLLPLSSPAMQDALESYRRLTDPELLANAKVQRHHQRERRA